MPNGEYLVKELPGPENFVQWISSWRVFCVACIMLNIATQAALHIYEKNIEKLTRLWPTAWHLIVLADDKCRAEHLERVRRRATQDLLRGLPAHLDWNAERPWSCCFRLAALDTAFWDAQVRHPAAAWMASGGRCPTGTGGGDGPDPHAGRSQGFAPGTQRHFGLGLGQPPQAQEEQEERSGSQGGTRSAKGSNKGDTTYTSSSSKGLNKGKGKGKGHSQD